MNERSKNTNNILFRKGKIIVNIFILFVFVSLSACEASDDSKKVESIDQITNGIQDKKMRELWKQAEREGKLPPLEKIPVVGKRVSQHQEPEIKKVEVSKPARPLVHEKGIVDITPFSFEPLTQYTGDIQIVEDKPGMLSVKMDKIDSPLEFHYKLPVNNNKVHKQTDTKLHLSFRDHVQDSALQRRIVLSKEGSIVPFVCISEGSDVPYRAVIKEIGLIIEQEKKMGNPPVKVTYMNKTVVLKQGESRKIGEGNKAVEIYLRSSVAINQKEQILREGQPFYIKLIIYSVD